MLSTEVLREHYAHLVEKPFFPSILAYMQSGPVQIMSLEGKDAVTIVRTMIGTTNPVQATFGTIRGDYAMHISKNCIHASENEAEAEVELKRFFAAEELFDYTSAAEANLYE
jgi:nucleoside-diphosphate kinase